MKKIILFVALGVPILVFIFLKFFGKNEFDIPVYYAEGIGRQLPGCNSSNTVPYLLPDSALNAWGWKGAKATLLVLNEKGIERNLARVAELFEAGDYATLKVENAPYEVKTCMLLAGDSSRVVMIDDQKRIRGYYTPTTEKETDRLGVEIRILLKQY
ncbi:MAG TPA: hypothetical protein VFE50_04755 [Cyclobacteriaceae bacterium]|nr:hypothetical protein [Cyclobacteriaceae bacterium]